MQERRSFSAIAMELRLCCTNPSIYKYFGHFNNATQNAIYTLLASSMGSNYVASLVFFFIYISRKILGLLLTYEWAWVVCLLTFASVVIKFYVCFEAKSAYGIFVMTLTS